VAASHFDFVNVVVAARGLEVTSSGRHHCRVESRDSELPWHCDLDDAFTNNNEADPATFIRWVCPALRVSRLRPDSAISSFEVRRFGPQSDLGKLAQGFGRLVGLAPKPAPARVQPRYVYTDPTRIVDDALRWRIENWPPASYQDNVVRPAQLSAARVTYEGLVLSASGWDSAPALDHQIGLAIDIAHRLNAQR
jgi:hypothetical protein